MGMYGNRVKRCLPELPRLIRAAGRSQAAWYGSGAAPGGGKEPRLIPQYVDIM
jgi:hypothetical protein